MHTKKATSISVFRKLGMTRREADVLLWITRGQSNDEIAASLGISPRTVKKHLERIYRKLGVKNRLAASVRAAEAEARSMRRRVAASTAAAGDASKGVLLSSLPQSAPNQ